MCCLDNHTIAHVFLQSIDEKKKLSYNVGKLVDASKNGGWNQTTLSYVFRTMVDKFYPEKGVSDDKR